MNLSVLQNGNLSLQSPNGGSIATAKFPSFTQVAIENHAMSTSDATSCSSLSPVASVPSSTSPTAATTSTTQQPLFQQGLLLDPRSPALLLQPSLTAVSPTASHLTEEEMDNDGGPFICCWESCNQEFPSLESLVIHLDRGHTLSMDKYICLWKDCARSRKPFDARYKLITHLRCHTGEKPYRCEYPTCTRSFSRLENLKLHVRTHTGEKPYECHYEGCTKKFNNTSDRAKHMKTHITRKPYVCKYPGCGKSYTDPSSMRKHIKYTHKLKERQEEMGHDGGGMTLSNGPLSHQRSYRKRDSSSSGSSLSPSTPNSQTPPRFIHLHPNIPGGIAIGPPAVSISGQFIHSLPSPPTASNATTATASSNQVQQSQLIPVSLLHLPGTPSSAAAQSLSFLPGLTQGSPLLTTHGGAVSQQQQVVMLLQSPSGVPTAPRRDIVTLPSQNVPMTNFHQQQQQQQTQHQNLKQSPAVPPIQVLQRTPSNGRVDVGQPAAVAATQATAMTILNEEEQLRMQIAQLQQQLLQSQQAQLLAQQQVAQLQMKQQAQQQTQKVDPVTELNEKQDRKTSPMNYTSSGSSIKLSPSKVTIVASSWPASSPAQVPASKSQTLINPPHSTSPPAPLARKASGQILLTSSVPILSPTGQTTVLPTQLPVMLGQSASGPTGGPQVIPIVQSQGVTQRPILYMTPSTT